MYTSFSHKILVVIVAALAFYAYANTTRTEKSPGSSYYVSAGADRS